MTISNQLLVMAGAIAVNKWAIDPSKVNVEIVTSPEPFKIRVPEFREVEYPPKDAKQPPHDNIVFDWNSDTHWQDDIGQDFMLAWGPKTNTLVICLINSGRIYGI